MDQARSISIAWTTRARQLLLKDDKRTADARKLLAAYKAMTSPSERALLYAKPRDMSVCGPLVNQLTKLLVKRMVQSYEENHISKPKLFGSGKKVMINTLVSNLTTSKLIVEPGNFQAWRARGEISVSAEGDAKREAEGDAKREANDDHSSPRKSPRKLGAPAREDSTEASSSEGEEGDGSEREVPGSKEGDGSEREVPGSAERPISL